jgi:hypothetical protein
MRDVTEGQISEFVERDAHEPANYDARRPLGIIGLIGGFFGLPTDFTAAREALLTEGLNFASETLFREGLNLAGLPV